MTVALRDIDFHVVTIPEGYMTSDIAKAMEDAGRGPEPISCISKNPRPAHLGSGA